MPALQSRPAVPDTALERSLCQSDPTELISTLFYLLLHLAKSGDDEVKLCAPVLAHASHLIHESGHRVAERLEDT